MKTDIENNSKIDNAYKNFNYIIEKKLPYKFSYLDKWIFKESELLIKEARQLENKINSPVKNKNKLFRTYQRGTIVKADFGIGIGSEMSQIHFAIVLNNFDNPRNNVLTVIPLTSKINKFNLYLGTLIIDLLIKKIQIEFEPISKKINNNIIINKDEKIKLNNLNNLIIYYKKNIKCTFACCNLITTISKQRIFLPENKYDIIGKARCSNEIMDKIDTEIKKMFTLTHEKK